MIYAYPKEVHDFVKKRCTKLRDDELAEACNKELGTEFTKEKMRYFRYNHGYKNRLGKLTREENLKRNTYYPKGMYEYIRDHSLGVGNKEMVERVKDIFGYEMTVGAMKNYRIRYGFKSGEKCWYRKGNAPATKGMKLVDICKNDPEKIAKVKETWFKSGSKPFNVLPIGSIVISSTGYKLRKKQMEGALRERWEMLHRAVWEEHNGSIPDGYVVTFKDGNKENCDIDNLLLVTKGENCALTRCGYRSEDPDITECGLTMLRLKRTMKEKKKKGKKGG